MVSTACFYSMLACIDRMLVSTQERAEDHMPGVAWQAPLRIPSPPAPAPDLGAHQDPPAAPNPPRYPHTPPSHTTFTASPPRADLTAAQFAVTRNAVFLVWHLFPIVWALAAADAISVEVEHMGCVPHIAAACAWRSSPTHAFNASPSLLPLSAHPLRPLLICLRTF